MALTFASLTVVYLFCASARRAVLGRDFDPEKLGVPPRPWFVLRDWCRHPGLITPAGSAGTATKG